MDAKEKARGRKRAQRAVKATHCERCGTTEGRLTRHHKDEDPLNNEPANLEVLCLSCHTSLHWEQGFRPRKKPKDCVICGETFTNYSHSRVKCCSRKCLSELGRRNAAKRKDRQPTAAPSIPAQTVPATQPAETP